MIEGGVLSVTRRALCRHVFGAARFDSVVPTNNRFIGDIGIDNGGKKLLKWKSGDV